MTLRTASHWSPGRDNFVECGLCPHHCRIAPGGKGICRVRMNVEGTLTSLGYGIYPAVHLDPIEKKPLNHFHPGSNILSLGSVGCNLTCRHCQNWSLARSGTDGLDGHFLPVSDLVELAGSRGSIGVAFTYNEPTINFEYIMEAAPQLRKRGSNIVLVTNGYLDKGAWSELMDQTDAANIDVKGFTEGFYKEIAGGSLAPVLENVKTAYEKNVHIEIAYLVIPGFNDDKEQVDGFIDFMTGEVSPDVPLHFNRFHPDHKMTDVPPTPSKTLFRIRDRAKVKGAGFVYIGNLGGKGLNDTVCPSCGKVLVDRDGFFSPKVRIRKGKCPFCSRVIFGRWQ